MCLRNSLLDSEAEAAGLRSNRTTGLRNRHTKHRLGIRNPRNLLSRQACPSLLSVPTDVKTHGDSLRRKLPACEFGSLREGAATSCESNRIFSDPERPTHVFSGRSWLNGCQEDLCPRGGQLGSDLGSRGLPP
jgi:hypothetical protein